MLTAFRKHFKKYRSIAVLSICLILLFHCGEQSSNSFTFVYMTDIHLQPEKSAVEGFEKAIARTNTINPDFVLTGGDLIMDALGQKESRADSLYDLYQESVKNFKMPVYNTLGNHEVFGLYVESGIDPQHPEYGKAMYKKRLKEESSYYSFNHKGWHFMVLDGIGYTEDRHYYGKIDSLQIRWIKEDLKNISKDTPIIISTHIPFYSLLAQAEGGPTKSLSEGAVITNGNKILELFEDYNLKLVLQGHLHIVEDLYYKGTHFITAGAVSGSWWNGPRYGFEEGFVVVEVRAGDFDWHYEDYGWEVAQKD